MTPNPEQVRRFKADVERLKGLDFIQDMAHQVENIWPIDVDPLDPPADNMIPLLTVASAEEARSRGLGSTVEGPAYQGCVFIAISQLVGEYRRSRLN